MPPALFAPQFPSEERALFDRAAAWPELPSLSAINESALRELTQRKGVDFATALFYDRFTREASRAGFIAEVDHCRDEVMKLSSHADHRGRLEKQEEAPHLSPLPVERGEGGRRPGERDSAAHSVHLIGRDEDLRVVIVPGALHEERPDMGGDGRVVRAAAEELGLECDFAPLASRGSAVDNAVLLLDWLERHVQRPSVLVSLSKGGPEVKLALGAARTARAFAPVHAWINVCGPLDGTPMADWLLGSPLRQALLRFQYWMQRRDLRFIADLRRGEGSPLSAPLRLPPHLRLISLVGFPLARHFSTPFSRFCHRRIAPLGPNDGTVLLADLLRWPGEVYPVWGADHYFRPEATARALIRAVLRWLHTVKPQAAAVG